MTDANFTDAMRAHSVSKIVYRPADDLIPRDRFQVWLIGEYVEPGQGDSVAEAFNDAIAKATRRAA